MARYAKKPTAAAGTRTAATPAPTSIPHPHLPKASKAFLFDPTRELAQKFIDEGEVITYSPDLQVTHLRAFNLADSNIYTDTRTLVVWVGCALNYKRPPLERAAWAVYFGPGSHFNCADVLPANIPQTRVTAEVYAMGQALLRARMVAANRPGLSMVRVVTDSEWLARAMEFCWEAGARSRLNMMPLIPGPMEDFRLLYENLRAPNQAGAYLEIKVWFVTPDMNLEASMMANAAFPQEKTETVGLPPADESLLNFEMPDLDDYWMNGFGGMGGVGDMNDIGHMDNTVGETGPAGGDMSGMLGGSGGVWAGMDGGMVGIGGALGGLGGMLNGMGGAVGEAAGVIGDMAGGVVGGAMTGVVGGDVGGSQGVKRKASELVQ